MKKILGYVAGVIVALAVIVFAATSITSANSRKPAKTVAMADRIALCSNYQKNSRMLTFKNGRKGALVTLRNGKKQCIKKYNVKRNGKFTITLTAKQAQNLSKCAIFKYTVTQKGYRAYSETKPVCKSTVKTAKAEKTSKKSMTKAVKTHKTSKKSAMASSSTSSN